ncbi:MAG: hypothetical protein ACQCXQ_05190 [Verrucomicrobiales bacterium]|nr:hypothetical protein [Verrucomicrobiota bacterium JB025]
MKKTGILLLTLLTSGVAFGAKAADEMNTVESLRKAIVFLTETHGADYPGGAAYLKRLEGISDADSEEYRELQREALLAHPHVAGYDWLVEVRDQYWGNHGPMNTLFQNGDLHGASGGLGNWGSAGSRLEVISIGGGGKVERRKVLAEQAEGMLRDADVSYDGKRVLFSMRANKDDDYHLYEMDADGGNLRQLTFGPMVSDVDPVYLPDGRIAFSSTRDPKFCQCNRHISQNIFRMEADGANIEQISGNGLSDFHSSVMPDGRLLYSRWEYVDRHFGPSLGLWTSNPDGTLHALYMGNNAWSPGSMLDARVIPGTDKVLCIYGACHDLPWGAMVVVDRSRGLEGPEPVLHIWPEEGRELISPDDDDYNRDLKHRGAIDNFRKLATRYEDPYPVHDLEQGDGGGSFFVVSKAIGGRIAPHRNPEREPVRMAVMLADVFGNEIVMYEPGDEQLGGYGAVPLAPRKTPRVIPDSVDYSKDHGTLYVNDVHLGDGDEMEEVKRGVIKWLRLIEAPPRQTYDERFGWGVDAQQVTAMNWNLTNNKRILGDVPVESDGSAYFKVPADRFVQIHALDGDKQMVQAMRSGTIVRPGETQGCVGCHENRVTVPQATNRVPLATRRPPSEIEPWLDTPSVDEAKTLNYLTDVQPVFDRHCVSCHDYGEPAGEVLNLAGDLSYPFNVSYMDLMSKSGPRYSGPEEKMVNFAGDGPPGVFAAYAWGSHRSKLVRVLKEGHHDVELPDEAMQRITSWIDANAVYYGPYASYYPGRNPMLALEDGLRKYHMVIGDLAQGQKAKQHMLEHGHLINFTRPELSPALERIGDEEARALALAYIREAGELLKQRPREDQTNSEEPRSEMDRFNVARLRSTKEEKACAVEAIRKGDRYYPYRDDGDSGE